MWLFSIVRRFLVGLLPHGLTFVFFEGLPGSRNGESIRHQLGDALQEAGHRGMVWPQYSEEQRHQDVVDNYQSLEWIGHLAAELRDKPKADAVLVIAYGAPTLNVATVKLAVLANIAPVIVLRFKDALEADDDFLAAGAKAMVDIELEPRPWVTIQAIEAALHNN